MKKPEMPKERNLVKAAIRRVFSRSELRRRAIEKALVKDYADPQRPRVTKWGRCAECGNMEPLYKMQVDHKAPVQPLGVTLEEMTWDELVDRVWCDERNLQTICVACHSKKSKAENAERRRIKKAKGGRK